MRWVAELLTSTESTCAHKFAKSVCYGVIRVHLEVEEVSGFEYQLIGFEGGGRGIVIGFTVEMNI